MGRTEGYLFETNRHADFSPGRIQQFVKEIAGAAGTHYRHIPIHLTLRAALIDLYKHQKPNVHPDQLVMYAMRSKGLSAVTVQD